jgi:hypothetical protein
MATGTVERIAPYIERFFDNRYARENLSEAVSGLRDAYHRGSKRGARAPTDRRFRDRLTDATVAMREAADALQSGRRRPKGQFAKRILLVVGLAAAAAAVAVGTSEDLRASLFGDSSPEDPSVAGGDGVENR